MRITIVLNDVVKFADQSRGLFVGKFKVHTTDMGWRFANRQEAEPRSDKRLAPKNDGVVAQVRVSTQARSLLRISRNVRDAG
jgi:hypothetical protein